MDLFFQAYQKDNLLIVVKFLCAERIPGLAVDYLKLVFVDFWREVTPMLRKITPLDRHERRAASGGAPTFASIGKFAIFAPV
jgi:hypothetical protein